MHHVIITDIGQFVTVETDSLSDLQQQLADLTHIPVDNQILLLPNGVQVKAQHIPDNDACVLFNRQLLETKDSHLVINDQALPTLPALPTTLLTTLAPDQSQWTMQCEQTFQTLAPILATNNQVALSLVDDSDTLHVAWKAAIANLDHHIKTTYDVQDQFDRMAQRELAKAEQTLHDLERDWVLFMQRWPVHPLIQTQKLHSLASSLVESSPPNSAASSPIATRSPLPGSSPVQTSHSHLPLAPLTTALDLSPLHQQRQQLSQQLQRLDAKRKKLLDRLDNIRQQATQLHKRETTAHTKASKELSSTMTQVDHVATLFSHLQSNVPPSPSSGTALPSTHPYPSSPTSPADWISLLDQVANANIAEPTFSTTLSHEQFHQSLLACEAHTREGVAAMIHLKRSTMRQLFRSLRVISSLQEAIANLFATLRHISQEVKKLGQKLDDLNQVTQDILKGYGMALIELWRRSQYNASILDHAKKLADWYTHVLSSEQDYRRNFLSNVTIVDQLESLFAPNALKYNVCMIPFASKDLALLTPSTKMHLTVTSDRKAGDQLSVEKEDVQDYIEALKDHYQHDHSDIVTCLLTSLTEATHYIYDGLTDKLQHEPFSSILHPIPNMQVQTVAPLPLKQDWPSLNNVMTQLQDLQSKYDALERQHEDGKKLFHQQRQTLLQDIKNKDQLLAEKEDQIQAQWASKVQALEDQLVQEKRDHDQDVLEWQQRYDQSMELEQRKSSRRLIEFHERLEAKSCCQQCGNKFRLQSHSAPSSPARRPSSLASSSPSLTSALSTSSPDTHSRRRYSLQSVEEVQTTFKLELLTREIQDSALRHQAHIDNLVAEHDQNIQDLKDQHQQALQLYHIQHECQLDEKDHQLRHNLAQAKTSLNLSHSKAITKLNKRVNWLKCELDLVQEEQASALQLAKSLNKQLDPALDLDDMKYTLVSLLQKAISGVSKSDALHYIKNCQQEEEQPSSWYC